MTERKTYLMPRGGLWAAALLVLALAGCPPAGPILAVFPAAFNFTQGNLTDTLTISNIGSGALNWQIVQLPAWVQANPAQGVAAADNSLVTLTVDPTGLPAGATSGQLIVSANGGAQTMTVPITVSLPQPPQVPALSLDTTELDFGQSGLALPLTITNGGHGTLTWTISEAIPWLSVATASGTTTTESDVVTITVDRAGLAAGPHAGTIGITSNGGNATVNVSLTVADAVPILGLSPSPPATLDIAADATQGVVTVKNVGTGTLSWTATPQTPWLSVNPATGDTGSVSTPIVVTVDRSQLVEGLNVGQISFTSNGGNQTLTVNALANPASLVVTPLTINFGSFTTDKLVTIANGGVGTVNWQVDQAALPAHGWLSAETYSGAVGSTPQAVLFHVNRAPGGTALTPGTYSVSLPITSNAGNATLNVIMTVAAQPVLAITKDLNTSPTTEMDLPFGLTLTELQFYVLNTGTGTLEWSTPQTALPPWLTLTRFADSVGAGGSSLVRAFVDRNLVEPYGDSFSLVITAKNGTTATVNFSVGIEQKPTIGSVPTEVDLGFNSDSAVLNIYNGGPPTTTLFFRVESKSPWMSVGPTTGTSEGREGPLKDYYAIGVAVNRSELDSDSTTGLVYVYALDPQGNDDLTVEPLPIEVTVKAPKLSFDIPLARLMVPNVVRWPVVMRDFRDRAITLTGEQVQTLNAPPAFRILEKGIEIEPTETHQFVRTPQGMRTNLVILLDYSGSMQAAAGLAGVAGANPLQTVYEQAVQQFVTDAFANVQGYLNVALMEFHDLNAAARLVQPFTNSPTVLINAVQSLATQIEDNGATELLPALLTARDVLMTQDLASTAFEQADTRDVVLISDGRRTTPPGEIVDTVNFLLERRIRVFTVGWGSDISRQTLIRIGSETGGYFYHAKENADGTPNVNNLLYRLSYQTPQISPPSSDPEKYRPITLPNDLCAQVMLGYTTLREESTVPVRFSGGFRDPIDDLNAPLITGSSIEQGLRIGTVVGDTTIGQLSMATRGIVGGNATVEIRADFVPRNINKLKFTVTAPDPFTFAPTPAANDGIVADWAVASTSAPNTLTVTLTAPAGTTLPYGVFGSIGALSFTGVPNIAFNVAFAVDNSIYLGDIEPKTFTALGQISVQPVP